MGDAEVVVEKRCCGLSLRVALVVAWKRLPKQRHGLGCGARQKTRRRRRNDRLGAGRHCSHREQAFHELHTASGLRQTLAESFERGT